MQAPSNSPFEQKRFEHLTQQEEVINNQIKGIDIFMWMYETGELRNLSHSSAIILFIDEKVDVPSHRSPALWLSDIIWGMTIGDFFKNESLITDELRAMREVLVSILENIRLELNEWIRVSKAPRDTATIIAEKVASKLSD